MAKKMRSKLAQARAYFRVAAKKSKAGDRSAEHYRKIAYQLVDRDRAEQEAKKQREASEKAYRAKLAAKKAAQQEPPVDDSVVGYQPGEDAPIYNREQRAWSRY